MRKTTAIFLLCILFASTAMAQDMPQGRRGIHRAEWRTRRAAGTQDRGPGGDYFKGEKHQMVILASFSDQTFAGDEKATIALWDSIFNFKNLDKPPFVGSVHDYFYDQSYEQFDLTFDLYYLNVGERKRYRSTENDDENSQFLVIDIVDSLEKRDIDWSIYDWNGDGYVNQILIIFAGKASSYGGFGGGYDAIWPHQWWLSEHLIDCQPGVYQSPRTVNSKGKEYIIDSYCAVQELSTNGSYSSFGTICHEYSHCFGFPDFYGEMSSTPDKWDLMDNGNYNGGGFCPAGYSAHERWIMGWLTPIELTSQTTVPDMPALADKPVAYLIRNDAYKSEYYILENRQKKGWDAELPGAGIVIFHIDYEPAMWISSDFNMVINTYNEQHYMLFPANNKTRNTYMKGWAYPYESNDSLTNTSAPSAILWHSNSRGTKLMGKPITQMSVIDGLASFEFSDFDPSEDDRQVTVKEEGIMVKEVRDGQLYIRRGELIYNVLGQSVR